MFKNIKNQFEEELAEMKAKGTFKEEGVLAGKQGAEISVGGKSLLNFCANNYLGLASSDDLARAAGEGMKTYGFGMASVRFICGTSVIHKDLEWEIASFLGTEDALLYTSCFDANTGLFETILQEGDAVFSDELNHASIIDGIRLCKAERFRYKHSDMADLEEKLKAAGSRRRKLIATDGVFSMDGDTARIAELADLAERYDAMLMVDDSHATGVIGARGRGSIEGYGDRVDIVTSTFGKALGGAGGGFAAGRKELIAYLRQKSRTSLFSNSLPPPIASAALYVLKNFDTQFQSLRAELAKNTLYFRSAMARAGFTLGGDGTHPITPVMLGDEKIATDMASALFEKGIYVRGFTYPVVPMGKARIRVQLSAIHTTDQMDRTIRAFTEVGKSFKVLRI
ncbi:MAG: glycine C-acetyltransferase [Candidatus Sungbacteria bacterium]|nr:glycine C-acetyltransferase [Candidatus Sungbacteria bacterium]